MNVLLATLVQKGWLAQLLARDADDLALMGLRAALTVVGGLIIGRMLGRVAGRFAAKRGGAQGEMVTRRFVFYVVFGLALFMTLQTLGVDIGVLVGAAGILTVAIGFASQTSASNLISGLFLLGERPFSIGDNIEVGTTTGEVLSIDLLSVKLRTFSNLFVRVPNETLIKSEITNLSRNPIRRMEIDLRVAYTEDLDRLRALLIELAFEDPDILEEPEPTVLVDRLGDSAIHIRLLCWASNRGPFISARSRVMEKVARVMQAEQVKVGYPTVSVDGNPEVDAGALVVGQTTTPASPP